MNLLEIVIVGAGDRADCYSELALRQPDAMRIVGLPVRPPHRVPGGKGSETETVQTVFCASPKGKTDMTNNLIHHFRDLKFCDSHFHYSFPEKLDTMTDIMEQFREYFSLDRMGLMALSRTDERPFDPTCNVTGLYLKDFFNKKHPGSAYLYGNPIHYFDGTDSADGYLAQVQRLYAMGVDGYKMLDGKPENRKQLGRPLCDPIFDKMYGFMEETGMPLVMHVADPRMFWKDKKDVLPEHLARGWWYGDKGYLSFEQLHQEVYGILEKFPKLKLCAAHFFFLSDDMEALTQFFERWENTAVDLTPAMMNLVDITHAPEIWKPFFEKYRHRIFFGSDNYLYTRGRDYIMQHHTCQCTMLRQTLEHTPREEFLCNSGRIVPLNLPEDILRDIYYNNHARLHPQPRPVDPGLIAEDARTLLDEIISGALPLDPGADYNQELANLRQILRYYR